MMLLLYRFSTNIEKQTIKMIHQCKTEQEVYTLFLKKGEGYTPEHYLETLKSLKHKKQKFTPRDLKSHFEQALKELYPPLPQVDKWKFYVNTCQHGGFKDHVKLFSQDLICKSVKQVAILLWGLSRNDIKKPRLAMRMIDQLQANLDKFQLIGQGITQSKNNDLNENQQESEDEFDDIMMEVTNSGVDNNKLVDNFNYKFKDLVLIIWSIKNINMENKEFLRFTFRQAIQNIDKPEIISNKSLILLLQATIDKRIDAEIATYQDHIIEHIEQQNLEEEGILLLVQFVHILGKFKKGALLAQKIAVLLLKKQSKSNFKFSSKFITLVIWNLNKLGIHDTQIYNKFGMHLLQTNVHKPMDLSQSILVYLMQFKLHSDFIQYNHIIKSLITKANQNKLDSRSANMIKQSLESYQPELLKLYKQ